MTEAGTHQGIFYLKVKENPARNARPNSATGAGPQVGVEEEKIPPLENLPGVAPRAKFLGPLRGRHHLVKN